MDKGTPKEVKAAYTTDQKIAIVKRFLGSQYTVESWVEVRRLLVTQQVTPVKNAGFYSRNEVNETDVEEYFKYLTDVASGSLTQASSALVKEAYMQLFAFIYALDRDRSLKMYGGTRLFDSQTFEEDWESDENQLYELREEISELKGRVDNLDKGLEERDAKITTILTRIETWFTLYEPTLARAKAEYDALDKRVQSGGKKP